MATGFAPLHVPDRCLSPRAFVIFTNEPFLYNILNSEFPVLVEDHSLIKTQFTSCPLKFGDEKL
jgi:hypothetical protein